MASALRVVWACARKDLTSALKDRAFTIAGLFLPVTVLILMSLFVLAGSHAPTAIVNQDGGSRASQFVAALNQARSFRLVSATAEEASRMMREGKIVATITLPPGFSALIDAGQRIAIPVVINNLNTDFTNDIR
ncbi:MAG TPA: ABC transporter permease, partial [bacterium]|nr:ABC transporter permease [bacterium]